MNVSRQVEVMSDRCGSLLPSFVWQALTRPPMAVVDMTSHPHHHTTATHALEKLMGLASLFGVGSDRDKVFGKSSVVAL